MTITLPKPIEALIIKPLPCLCGCGNVTLNRYIKGHNRRTHKLSKHPLYRVHNSMKCRCNNQNDSTYEYYGARGIRVAKEWHAFEQFYLWAIAAGWKRGLVIDRIDPKGHYCPENCRWITLEENVKRATSVPVKCVATGKEYSSLKEAEIANGIPPGMLRYRFYEQQDFYCYYRNQKWIYL